MKLLLLAGILILSWIKVPGLVTPYAHGKWLAFDCLSILCGLLFLYRPSWPAFSKKESVAALAIFLLAIGNILWLRPVAYAYPLLDRLSFFLLVLCAWQLFSRNKIKWEDFCLPLAVASLVTSVYGIFQAMNYRSDPALIGSTFGYANNAAQLLGIALIFLLAFPQQKKWQKWSAFAVIGVNIGYLAFSKNRSVWIGLIVAAAVMFAVRKKKLGKVILGTGILLCLGLIVFFGQELLQLSLVSKSSMGEWRWEIWKYTVELIRAYPFGVGPDNFEFSFVEFHRNSPTISENAIAVSPHNEFLRFLAEDGIAVSLLYAAAVLFFLRTWWKTEPEEQEKKLLLPLFAFYLVEMAVQFPWENAVPAYIGAIFLAGMAARIWKERPASRDWRWGILLIILLAQTVLFGRVLVSRLWETSMDLDKASYACSLAPGNWRACLRKAGLEMDKQKFSEARITAGDVLALQPWNFQAMRFLSLIAFHQQNRLEGCFLLWRCNDILRGNSGCRTPLEQNCPKRWIEYFNRKRPQRYYPR